MKVPDVPCVAGRWQREHPGGEVPGGRVFARPWPAGPKDKRRDQVTCCRYRAGRARRTLHGTAGPAPVRRNRFTAPDGAVNSVDRELEARARTPAGIRGCQASLAAAPDGEPATADFAIGSYHEPWNIGKSFRMPEPDLQAGPVCHRRRDSVEARLTAVSAALALIK